MSTALDAHEKLFARNPDSRRAFEAIEEQYFLDGQWQALADIYRARIAAPSIADDSDQLGPLLFRLGQILEERIVDPTAASEVYWQLARLDPSNRPALRQLRGIHEQQQQWDMVLQIAELESQTDMPAYERAAFDAELGRYWLDHLEDPDEAQKAFERSLESDPALPAALEGLASIHKSAGRHIEAAQLLEQLTDRLRGPERAPFWVALGILNAGALEDLERATQCFERALDDDPFFIAAVEWSLLLATAAEDWNSVSDLLESRFDLASGARHRAAIAVEASQIQLTHLGSNAAARAWVERATELAGDELSVLLARADVERADGDLDALQSTLGELISIGGPNVPRDSLMEAAELRAELGQSEAALEALHLAAEKPTGHDLAILTLQARLLRDAGSRAEFAEALETLIDFDGLEDPVELAESLRELARIREEDLSDESGAQNAWQRAFELDASSEEAFSALERIYRKASDDEALRHLFESAIQARSALPQATLHANLGTLLLGVFEDETTAKHHFNAAIEADESCRPALAGLRRIAESNADDDLLLRVCKLQASSCDDSDELAELALTCLPILKQRRSHQAALEWARRWSETSPDARPALEWQADMEAQLGQAEAEIRSRAALARFQEGPERATTLRRQAELQVSLDDLVAASTTLELALESDPGRVETLSTMAEIYRILGRAEDLSQCLRQWVDTVPREEQLPILEELANLLHDPLGELDAAIVIRWRVAEHPAAPDDAPLKLEALLDLAGRYTEMVQLLDARRAKLGDDSPQALELDSRRGRLRLDSLGQCEEAAEIFSKLHERHPEDETILNDLERALRTGDDAQGLCNLLERRAGWESDPDRRLAIQFERAMLLDEALGQPLDACDLYESIARQEAGSEHATFALARLETLLESHGEWPRLRALLAQQVETASADRQASRRERIAQICSERLGDIGGCAEQLEAIARTTKDRVHVWQRLEEIYRSELDRPNDWLRVVEAELESDPTPDREFSLRVSAARLFLDDEKRPHDRQASEAIAHYECVLTLDPTHSEAAEVLALHHTASGRYDEAVRVLETRLAHLDDGGIAAKSDLQLRLAELLSIQLEDDARALTHYEAAREALGAIPRIAEPLAQIYARAERFEALAELSREILGAENSDRPPNLWRVRLATSERALGQLDAAALSYRAALLDSPNDREIEDALIDLYEDQNEFHPLAELLEKRLPYALFEEGIALRFRLARVLSEGLDEPRKGLELLEAILDAHPQHRDAFEFAMDLADRVDDPVRLVSLLDRALDTDLQAEERARLLERRGGLIAEQLGNPEQSLPCFREAIALAPARESARLALRKQLEGLERWPAVLDCLFVEAANSSPEQRNELLERATEIAWKHVRPDAALPWIARLREERPDDPSLLERLGEIHRRAGRFEAALNTIDEEICMRPTEEDACRLYIERARLLERELQAPGRAIVSYQHALAAASSPEQRSLILCELDRLYAATERPVERAKILEERVANLGGEEGIALRQTLAALYCVDLVKPDLAIAPLLVNVDATRDDPAIQMGHLGALDAALRASARPDMWARVAEKELELIDRHPGVRDRTPTEYQLFVREELARVYDVELGNPDRAIAHLRRAVDEYGASERSAEELRNLLRRCGNSTELTQRLSSHLTQASGSSDEWLELARLREERMHDLRGAMEAYQQAARDERTSIAALRGLRRCAERLGDFDALADILQDEVEPTSRLDPNQRAAAARRLGEISWKRLHDPERAVAAYDEALRLEPENLSTLRALLGVREAGNDSEATLALYRHEIELLGDTDSDRRRAREVWLRMAAGLSERDESTRSALDAYQSAADIERLDAPDELRMSRLHETLGESESFFEIFGLWCDRDDSRAGVAEHLELARRLADAGDSHSARERAKKATKVDPRRSEAWGVLAGLERDAERPVAAADAFSHAANTADPERAARYAVDGAACLAGRDPNRAWELLGHAIARDPACVEAHVSRLRLAAELGRDEETLREARHIVEFVPNDSLDKDVRLELALLAGRAALDRGEQEAQRLFFGVVVSIDPDHIEGLEGMALADFEIGDLRTARVTLEHRIELAGENPDLGLHLGMIAHGLEVDGLLDAAWARFEEAIEADPNSENAHAGLVRVHERSARVHEALECLERWSRCDGHAAIRAQAATRAGEQALALDDPDRARRNLEEATRLDSEFAPAWQLLCQIAVERGPTSDARRLCDAALDSIRPGPLSAQIALHAARLAESAGEMDLARERYAEAARWEPRCVDAALSESRLARSAGDWVGADSVLAEFLQAHPDAQSPTLAHVYLERGRLLSGPLEGFEEAIRAYELSLELQPELHVARTALAGLLLHSPDRWAESLALHRELLAASPTNTSSIRALAQIAEHRGRPDLTAAALSLLHALGQAAPREVSESQKSLQFPVHAGPPMSHADGERLRRMAHLMREELAAILPEVEVPDFASRYGEIGAIAIQIRDIEAELTAPKLAGLDASEQASLFSALTGLFLDPGSHGADSRYRDELNDALGRWTRRKVRRIAEETTLAEVESFDYQAWGSELRALSAAQALDRNGGNLRSTLRALLILESPNEELEIPDSADLGALVSDSDSARRLLARITDLLCERLA